MNYYATSYSYPFNLQGTIVRTVTLLGCTDLSTRRIQNMPSNNAIEFSKGDNKMIRIFVKDENLNIINLNGAIAKFYLASKSTSSTYIFSKTTANYTQGIIKTPERGEVIFFINTEDTEKLASDQYFYQIIVKLSNGNRYTVASGNLNLKSNLEYADEEPPYDEPEAFVVPIPANSYSIKIDIGPSEIIIPSLSAPSGSSEQIWITNLVYSAGFVTVYFSVQIVEDGWSLAYTVSEV